MEINCRCFVCQETIPLDLYVEHLEIRHTEQQIISVYKRLDKEALIKRLSENNLITNERN